MLVLAFLNLNPHSSKLSISVKIDQVDAVIRWMRKTLDLLVCYWGLRAEVYAARQDQRL